MNAALGRLADRLASWWLPAVVAAADRCTPGTWLDHCGCSPFNDFYCIYRHRTFECDVWYEYVWEGYC